MGTQACDADDKLGGESRCSMRRITVLRTTASWPACPYSLLIPPPITSKHFLSAIKEWGYVRQPNARVISPHTELRLRENCFTDAMEHQLSDECWIVVKIIHLQMVCQLYILMLFAMSVVRGGDVENFQMTRGLLPGPTFAHLPAGFIPTSEI